jgi:hypothetical protein
MSETEKCVITGARHIWCCGKGGALKLKLCREQAVG